MDCSLVRVKLPLLHSQKFYEIVDETDTRNATDRAGKDALCKKYPGHQMCNPKVGPKCIESENGRGFTKAEQKEMIKLHNQLRRKVHRP